MKVRLAGPLKVNDLYRPPHASLRVMRAVTARTQRDVLTPKEATALLKTRMTALELLQKPQMMAELQKSFEAKKQVTLEQLKSLQLRAAAKGGVSVRETMFAATRVAALMEGKERTVSIAKTLPDFISRAEHAARVRSSYRQAARSGAVQSRDASPWSRIAPTLEKLSEEDLYFLHRANVFVRAFSDNVVFADQTFLQVLFTVHDGGHADVYQQSVTSRFEGHKVTKSQIWQRNAHAWDGFEQLVVDSLNSGRLQFPETALLLSYLASHENAGTLGFMPGYRRGHPFFASMQSRIVANRGVEAKSSALEQEFRVFAALTARHFAGTPMWEAEARDIVRASNVADARLAQATAVLDPRPGAPVDASLLLVPKVSSSDIEALSALLRKKLPKYARPPELISTQEIPKQDATSLEKYLMARAALAQAQ